MGFRADRKTPTIRSSSGIQEHRMRSPRIARCLRRRRYETSRNVVMRARTGGVIAMVVGLCAGLGDAQANDDANNPDKYPNWRGQWYRTLPVQWDASKPPGRGQQAPLTPEYQARYEISLAEQRRGGQDYKPQVKCMPAGMPQMMIAYEPIEIIVTPQETYMWMV